jgi:hypothetical protein
MAHYRQRRVAAGVEGSWSIAGTAPDSMGPAASQGGMVVLLITFSRASMAVPIQDRCCRRKVED